MDDDNVDEDSVWDSLGLPAEVRRLIDEMLKVNDEQLDRLESVTCAFFVEDFGYFFKLLSKLPVRNRRAALWVLLFEFLNRLNRMKGACEAMADVQAKKQHG